MHEDTITAAVGAVQQILTGLSLDAAMVVLGSATTITITNNAKTDDEVEKIAEKFIDVFAHTIEGTLKMKGRADVGH